ncbi:hypothetical protein AJ87_17420 [Rhizobium yanglingense]|nr:hypothetical protein AJ87_17420 [Rhizobium yanglingense]
MALKAAGKVVVAEKTIQSLEIDANVTNVPASIANGFVPGLAAGGTVSGTVTASGTLSSPAVDFRLDWKDLATSQTKGAKLSSLNLSATGKFADNKLDFDANASGADGASLKAIGNVAIAGKTVESLKVDADIADLPAGIANNFVPGLAAEGVLSGTVVAEGSLASPTADFKLNWKNAATSHTKKAGLSQLAVNATGKLANNRLDFDANMNGADNVTLKAGGNVMMEGTVVKSLKVDANVSNLPASVANGFVPGLAAEGTISGTASVSGPLSAPKVDFKLNWKNAATSQTKGAGLSPFAITANGELADNTLTIDTDLPATAAFDEGWRHRCDHRQSGPQPAIPRQPPLCHLGCTVGATGLCRGRYRRHRPPCHRHGRRPRHQRVYRDQRRQAGRCPQEPCARQCRRQHHHEWRAGHHFPPKRQFRERRQRYGERYGRDPAGQRLSGKHRG